MTPALFAKYPDARAYAEADSAALEEDVRPTGFYRNKAKAIRGACLALAERFGGSVPADGGHASRSPGSPARRRTSCSTTRSTSPAA